MTERPLGQIITFYSYKGGTGRTMALANLACLLARPDAPSGPEGAPRVLAIDWDFEAPGLHRYFQRYLKPESAESFTDTQGCLELFEQLRQQRSSDDPYDPNDFVANRLTAKLWFEAQDLDQYVVPTSFPCLSLMKAGRFDPTYPRRVSEFRWDNLFHETVGLFTGFVDFLRSRFDYILVDSRTGTTDTSGICTMLLPDKLVVVFTPNQQSLTGIETLAAEAVAYRKRSPDGRPLTIFPLPSRVEMARPQLLEAWRNGGSSADASIATLLPPNMSGYQPMFERLFENLYARSAVHLEEYFNEVMLQHIPDYAYGEPIAVALETGDSRISLSRSYSAFRDRLIELDVPWNSLTAIRQERDVVRRCEAIDHELTKKSIEEAIKLSFALIERMPPEHLFERWSDTIFEVARAAKRENGSAASALVREWARSALSENEIDPSSLGEALRVAGTLSQELGEGTLAAELLSASLACFTNSFGNEHPATLTVLDQLASAAFSSHDYSKARILYENALQIRRRMLGPADPSTLETMNSLALTLFEQGDVVGAKSILEEMLARRRETTVDRRWAAIETLNHLVLGQIDQRELRAARDSLAQLQTAYRQAREHERPDAVTAKFDATEMADGTASSVVPISGQPIAALDIVKPSDFMEATEHDFFYLAPGYQQVDKMVAQPVAVGEKRLDFLALQACRLDGVTLIWQGAKSGRAWMSFGRGAIELPRGEMLRLYLNWLNW
ncbi:KGGVGR-motif variant AAA ATPase [Bradyrhizobium sp. DASA03076]|uniref:KGGVGR-motif variant AAA ATPase n=1 Tax=Bradyrhizobium sp. BLXBL-03 TaxID=3395916 RepID=UPI003F712024